MSPTARTLQVLREMGYRADIVERWVAPAKIHKDFLGFADIVGVHVDHGIIAIQTTTTGNAAARVAKALQQEGLSAWLRHGRAEIWGWALRGARGKRKMWTLSRRRLVLDEDLRPISVNVP